jgi:hypothetical protein
MPNAVDGILNGVSCTSQTSCVAVGSKQNHLNLDVPLIEVWNGLAWSRVLDVTPFLGSVLDFAAVSCSSPTWCVAIGPGPLQSGPHAVQWNGITWSALTLPNLSTDTLNGVSCTSQNLVRRRG